MKKCQWQRQGFGDTEFEGLLKYKKCAMMDYFVSYMGKLNRHMGFTV